MRSFERTRPAFSTSIANVSKTFGGKVTATPSRSSRRSAVSSVNTPKP